MPPFLPSAPIPRPTCSNTTCRFAVYFLAAGLLTGVVGAMVGFPALRLQGIYLVIATISFAFIVEEILARWESVTHGNEGMRVKTLTIVRHGGAARQSRRSISSALAC